jgi:hypothetical protein
MPTRNTNFASGFDVAWIIELWRAVHGGDPSPEDVAAEVIAAMSQYLECSPGACILQTSAHHVC